MPRRRAPSVPAQDRAQAVVYAAEHGDAAAAARYGITTGTIKSWRSRAKSRGAEVPTTTAPVVPAITSLDQTSSATLYEAACVRCDRRYVIKLGELAAIFAARQQPVCPRCQQRVARCVTIPKSEWQDGLVAYAQVDAWVAR